MAGIVYRIRDWDELFENNRTRALKSLHFVLVPNKHDGEGYLTLLDHPDGPSHYAAWHAILQVASKCRPRGTLVRDSGRPHTAASIARKTSFPVGVVTAALERLASADIDWLEVLDADALATIPREGAEIRHPSAPEGKGREGNRREENGKEKTPPSPSPPLARALPRGSGGGSEGGDWEEARRVANEIVRSLEVHAPDEGKYRRLIIQAAYLSRHTLDDEWLRDAIEDTRRKRPQSVWGYFRACLASGCDSRGFDLDQLLVATKVPVKFLTRA